MENKAKEEKLNQFFEDVAVMKDQFDELTKDPVKLSIRVRISLIKSLLKYSIDNLSTLSKYENSWSLQQAYFIKL